MKHETIYIFDVDGTLTLPTQPISPSFGDILFDFVKYHNCFIVSGASYSQLQFQLGRILNVAQAVFPCLGNEEYQNGQLIQSNSVEFEQTLIQFCTKMLWDSYYTKKGNKTIEHMPGLLNLSVIGHSASEHDRKLYSEYDKKVNERQRMVDKINESFCDYEASIGGSVSIDVCKRNYDKSQILDYEILKQYSPETEVHFFADRIFSGGNDWSLASRILNTYSNSTIHRVSGFVDTRKIIGRLG